MAETTPPERVDVSGLPRTKEELEHSSRYEWAAGLVSGDVLDVACGTGYGSLMLAQTGGVTSVISMDRDPLSLSIASIRGAQTVLAEVPPIPSEDSSFDWAVSFETLEHIERDGEFVAELSRVLKPSGQLLVSTPNAKISSNNGVPQNPWHTQEYTIDELKVLLDNAGFVPVAEFGQSFPPRIPRGHRYAWMAYGRMPATIREHAVSILGDLAVRPRAELPDGKEPAYWIVQARPA